MSDSDQSVLDEHTHGALQGCVVVSHPGGVGQVVHTVMVTGIK